MRIWGWSTNNKNMEDLKVVFSGVGNAVLASEMLGKFQMKKLIKAYLKQRVEDGPC